MNLVYKDILVISDNADQCVGFYSLIKNIIPAGQVNFSWGCSNFSDKEIFNAQTGLIFSKINLKEDQHVQNIIKNYSLVISMHCKQLFPAELISKVKCINVHPGYNPVNRGWYPQVFSIINKTIIGATIHEIDEKLDHGNIIDRMQVEKHSWDTSFTLYKRIMDAEIILLNKNLVNILCNDYKTIQPENEGNFYLKKDFNQLCNLDINATDSFENFIDRLRALSHGSYKNAYYTDKEYGKKVYVTIQLQPEED